MDIGFIGWPEKWFQMNTDVAPCLCQQVCHGIDVESSHARNYFLMPLSQHKFITTLSQDNKACVLMITGGGVLLYLIISRKQEAEF